MKGGGVGGERKDAKLIFAQINLILCGGIAYGMIGI